MQAAAPGLDFVTPLQSGRTTMQPVAGYVDRSDLARQQVIRQARRAIGRGHRPVYHAKWQWDGKGADIEILELPGVWTVAPTATDVDHTTRHRIAIELGVSEDAFDVVVVPRRAPY
jgi:hypothetical protein